MSNDDVEIATAKKAISDYVKAVGDPKGTLELDVVLCRARRQFFSRRWLWR